LGNVNALIRGYCSDSFGGEPVDLEIGKKENRTGDTGETTMAEFLKVLLRCI